MAQRIRCGDIIRFALRLDAAGERWNIVHRVNTQWPHLPTPIDWNRAYDIVRVYGPAIERGAMSSDMNAQFSQVELAVYALELWHQFRDQPGEIQRRALSRWPGQIITEAWILDTIHWCYDDWLQRQLQQPLAPQATNIFGPPPELSALHRQIRMVTGPSPAPPQDPNHLHLNSQIPSPHYGAPNLPPYPLPAPYGPSGCPFENRPQPPLPQPQQPTVHGGVMLTFQLELHQPLQPSHPPPQPPRPSPQHRPGDTAARHKPVTSAELVNFVHGLLKEGRGLDDIVELAGDEFPDEDTSTWAVRNALTYQHPKRETTCWRKRKAKGSKKRPEANTEQQSPNRTRQGMVSEHGNAYPSMGQGERSSLGSQQTSNLGYRAPGITENQGQQPEPHFSQGHPSFRTTTAEDVQPPRPPSIVPIGIGIDYARFFPPARQYMSIYPPMPGAGLVNAPPAARRSQSEVQPQRGEHSDDSQWTSLGSSQGSRGNKRKRDAPD